MASFPWMLPRRATGWSSATSTRSRRASSAPRSTTPEGAARTRRRPAPMGPDEAPEKGAGEIDGPRGTMPNPRRSAGRAGPRDGLPLGAPIPVTPPPAKPADGLRRGRDAKDRRGAPLRKSLKRRATRAEDAPLPRARRGGSRPPDLRTPSPGKTRARADNGVGRAPSREGPCMTRREDGHDRAAAQGPA